MRNVFFIRNSIEEIDWEFLFVTAFHFWSLWLVNGERFVPMLAPFAFHSQSSSSIHFCNLIEMFRLFAYFFIAKLCTKNFLFQFDRRLLLYERSYSSIFFFLFLILLLLLLPEVVFPSNIFLFTVCDWEETNGSENRIAEWNVPSGLEQWKWLSFDCYYCSLLDCLVSTFEHAQLPQLSSYDMQICIVCINIGQDRRKVFTSK